MFLLNIPPVILNSSLSFDVKHLKLSLSDDKATMTEH